MQQLTKTKPSGCVLGQAGLCEWPVRQSPQCPGGRRPPVGCRRRGSGMVSVKGEPEVWPCSCAARWRVRSGKPQSGNTFPLSPGCKTTCSCPGDTGPTKVEVSTKFFFICGCHKHPGLHQTTAHSALTRSLFTHPPAGLLHSLFHPVMEINDVEKKVGRLQHLLRLKTREQAVVGLNSLIKTPRKLERNVAEKEKKKTFRNAPKV